MDWKKSSLGTLSSSSIHLVIIIYMKNFFVGYDSLLFPIILHKYFTSLFQSTWLYKTQIQSHSIKQSLNWKRHIYSETNVIFHLWRWYLPKIKMLMKVSNRLTACLIRCENLVQKLIINFKQNQQSLKIINNNLYR